MDKGSVAAFLRDKGRDFDIQRSLQKAVLAKSSRWPEFRPLTGTVGEQAAERGTGALFFCAWRQVIMPTQRLLCGW